LNKTGLAQAEKIRAKLKGLKIDKVFCSDLKRSCQTAGIIFGNRKCGISKNANLREMHFGKWEGLNYRQVSVKYPRLYKKWLKDPFSADIPLGEKMNHFISRVKKELNAIINKEENKTVAIVSHLGVMRAILNNCLGAKKEDFWGFKIEPKAVYIIEHNGFSKPQVYKL